MGEARWLSEEEERSWRALQFMQMAIVAEMSRDLATSSDLSYSEYLVLVGLTDQADDRLRLTDLAELLGWEQSRLSHLVSRMAARGLVERVRCDSDRRGCFVVLTELGRHSLDEAAPIHLASVRRLFFDHLEDSQVRAVGDAAERVLAGLPATSARAR